MINLLPTRDYRTVMSFLQGDGIRKLCLGAASSEQTDSNILKSLADHNNHTMVIDRDGDKVGWISFIMIGADSYVIHVCLRTIGRETREAISLALKYIKIVERAKRIYAVFPESRRALISLAKVLGFKDDTASFNQLAYPATKRLVCKRLDLN